MKKQQPQLPAPRKKTPKDAARAVKRTGSLSLQEVTPNTLSELLGLPGMYVIRYAIEEENQERFPHVFCEHAQEVAVCPRCLTPTDNLHEVKERCVRHLDIWGMKTLVHFPQRRFGCSVCGRRFTEVLVWIDPKRRQTLAFELHIYEQVKGKTPRCQVALQEGLHEAVVAEIFKRQAPRALRATPWQTVRVLGVDEISLRKGHKQYALVLSDLERHRVIAVLPDRRKATFEAWLLQLSFEEQRAIKTVSMDMWEPYRQAVQRCLPQAEIVADRFYVMKQLNHKLDLLRRSLQRTAKRNGDDRLYQALKGNRWSCSRIGEISMQNKKPSCKRSWLLRMSCGRSICCAKSSARFVTISTSALAPRASWPPGPGRPWRRAAHTWSNLSARCVTGGKSSSTTSKQV